MNTKKIAFYTILTVSIVGFAILGYKIIDTTRKCNKKNETKENSEGKERQKNENLEITIKKQDTDEKSSENETEENNKSDKQQAANKNDDTTIKKQDTNEQSSENKTQKNNEIIENNKSDKQQAANKNDDTNGYTIKPKSKPQIIKPTLPIQKPQKNNLSTYIQKIDSLLNQEYTKNYSKMVFTGKISQINNYNQEIQNLIRKICVAYENDRYNEVLCNVLVEALNDINCLKYMEQQLENLKKNQKQYGHKNNVNISQVSVKNLIEKIIIIYSNKNAKKKTQQSEDEINFTKDITTNEMVNTDNNTKPYGLKCQGINNTCFMMTFLQIILSIDAYKQAIKENSTKHTLINALNIIINELEGQKTSNLRKISHSHMSNLYKELNKLLSPEIPDQEKFILDEQNTTITALNLFKELQVENEYVINNLHEIKPNNNDNIYEIALAQRELRLNEKNSLYEALDYFFKEKDLIAKKFSKHQFTKLPQILSIRFHKIILTNIYDNMNERASFGVSFTPYFTLNEQNKEVQYVFRVSIQYISITSNNNEDTGFGHYIAIVLHNNVYYLCNDSSVTVLNKQDAFRRISLYGITWIYEKF